MSYEIQPFRALCHLQDLIAPIYNIKNYFDKSVMDLFLEQLIMKAHLKQG